MELIDRYVFVVTEHLKANIREDVKNEVRANIEDMLPEDPFVDDVRKVLINLGDPRVLAQRYSERKKYLIGPMLYDNYLSVLKLVIYIVGSVVLGLNLVEWVFNPNAYGKFAQVPIRLFMDIVAAVVQGVLQGFLWVTLAFAIIESSGVNEGKIPLLKKKWSVDDLVAVPVSKKKKISRIETVFSIFCCVFFTSLICFNAELIGLYMKGSHGIVIVETLFVKKRLELYISIILILTFTQLIVYIWKFISRKWSFKLAIINATQNLLLSIFVCVVISDKYLFNQDLLLRFAKITTISITQILSYWNRSIWITAVIFIIISLIDSVMGFVKSKK